MYCNSSGYGDYLPVDFAVNGILVCSWNYVANRFEGHGIVTAVTCTTLNFYFFTRDFDRSIYHLTSSAEIKVSWEQIINIGRWVVCNRLPLNGVMWYPGGSMKSSRLHHNICSFFYHWVPAFFIDCLLFCIGYPPV